MGMTPMRPYQGYGNVIQQYPRSPRGVVSPNFNACVPFFDTVNSIPSDSCCVSFKLQPGCTDNRHLHARLQKVGRAACLSITDLTHNKTAKCQVYNDTEIELLPRKLLNKVDLQPCNVVGLRRGLVVVQIFCQDFIKFVLCSINEQRWLLTYNKKYLPQGKLHLYECHISADEQYMIIKQNQIYATLYNLTRDDHEGYSVLKIENDVCKQVSCECLNDFISLSRHKVAVAFDPRCNNDLVVYSNETNDRGIIGLYKLEKDAFLFTMYIFTKDCPALPGRFQNLQFLRDGSTLVLSVLGSEQWPRSISVMCINQIVTVYLLDPDYFEKVGSFSYVTLELFQQYAPMISASGKMGCCGGRIYSFDNVNPQKLGVKSLKRICYGTIVDWVLEEDIEKLPLPKPLLSYLSNAR